MKNSNSDTLRITGPQGRALRLQSAPLPPSSGLGKSAVEWFGNFLLEKAIEKMIELGFRELDKYAKARRGLDPPTQMAGYEKWFAVVVAVDSFKDRLDKFNRDDTFRQNEAGERYERMRDNKQAMA